MSRRSRSPRRDRSRSPAERHKQDGRRSRSPAADRRRRSSRSRSRSPRRASKDDYNNVSSRPGSSYSSSASSAPRLQYRRDGSPSSRRAPVPSGLNGGNQRGGNQRDREPRNNATMNDSWLQQRRLQRLGMPPPRGIWEYSPPPPSGRYGGDMDQDRKQPGRGGVEKPSYIRSRRDDEESSSSSSSSDSSSSSSSADKKTRKKKHKKVKKRAPADPSRTERDAEGMKELSSMAASMEKKQAKIELDDTVGPKPLPKVDVSGISYGGNLLAGEAEGMARFVQDNKRIPRRGEIGLTSDQIAAYEDVGFVMSGSRHRRMNAVRMRKESQIYSAEEAKALAALNFEEKVQKETKILAGFRQILTKKLGSGGGGVGDTGSGGDESPPQAPAGD